MVQKQSSEEHQIWKIKSIDIAKVIGRFLAARYSSLSNNQPEYNEEIRTIVNNDKSKPERSTKKETCESQEREQVRQSITEILLSPEVVARW